MANKNQSASYPSKVRAKWYFLAEDTINAFLEAEKYFQFKILGIQNDNGSENNGIPNIIKKIKKNPDTVGILFLRAEENKRFVYFLLLAVFFFAFFTVLFATFLFLAVIFFK